MKIGVDLRSLQIGHQYRGIGEVVRRTLNDILLHGKNDHEFIFFVYDKADDPLRLIEIPEGLSYEVRITSVIPTDKSLTIGQKLSRRFRTLIWNPIPKASDCKVFLQYDYALGVPWWTKTILVKHDIIPYIFWDEYFTSPVKHFKNKAARTTLRTILHNFEYKRVLSRSTRKAKKIVAVSKNTKKDLIEYLGVKEKKITVIHPGVSDQPLSDSGRLSKKYDMPTKDYLLFIGAADSRRRVEDLIDAFNNLKGAGEDIQLVLAGENFASLKEIKSPSAKRAVKASSYVDDIVLMGYIDDELKTKLYKGAIAYVFPSLYEGFGIPVLEAMLNSCPVITYKNSAIPEVAGDHAYYTKDWKDIWKLTAELRAEPDASRTKHAAAAKKHAQKFSWDKTAKSLYKLLTTK